jgi:hypothetical protein
MKTKLFNGLTEADHKRFVGSHLRMAREAIGVSAAAWVREYQLVSAGKLTNWEKGANYPNAWFLTKLCVNHGFTMDWFYRGVPAGVSFELAGYLRAATEEKKAERPAKEVRSLKKLKPIKPAPST